MASNKLLLKRAFSILIIISLTALLVAANAANIGQVKAQSTALLSVTGYNGQVVNYTTLSDLQNLPAVSGYGGFYQPNQHQINYGNWTGVSLLYLCNQVGGITSTCNVTVIGQGTNNFTYDMVNSGTNLNLQYNTYSNLGVLQNQTQSVQLILAYTWSTALLCPAVHFQRRGLSSSDQRGCSWTVRAEEASLKS